MPIFEYRCSGCGRKFERLVLGRRAAASPCPRCGARKAERVPSRFAAVGASKSEGDDFDEFDGGTDDETDNGWSGADDELESAGGGEDDAWEDDGEDASDDDLD